MYLAYDPSFGWGRITAADYCLHLRDAAEHPAAYEGWIFVAR